MANKKSFPWVFFIICVVGISTAVVYYRSIKHNDMNDMLKDIQLIETLKDLGIWEYGVKALDGANCGLNWTRQRIEEFAPGYIQATEKAMYPYIELAVDLQKIALNMLANCGETLWEHLIILMNSLEKQIFKIHNYLMTEVFVGKMSPENILNVIHEFTSTYSIWVYEKVISVFYGN